MFEFRYAIFAGLSLLCLIYLASTYNRPTKPDCCEERIKQLQKSFDSTHSKCFRYIDEKRGWE